MAGLARAKSPVNEAAVLLQRNRPPRFRRLADRSISFMPLKLSPTQIAFNARGDGRFNRPFQEQLAFFRQKLNLPTERYDDILKEAHDRAFVVAGAMKADLLADFRDAIDNAIENGKSIGWFRKQFDAIVKRHGWEGWTGSDSPQGRDWRTRVIYRTNLASSYAAGRWAQLNDPDLLKTRPYWEYVHNDTVQHPRPLHVSWSGMVLRHDHPWWQTHFPPNGWGCRCRVKAVRARKYEGAEPPEDGVYTRKDRQGNNHVIPKGIDYGWDYAPGASVGNLVGTIRQKLPAMPPPVAEGLKKDLDAVVPANTEFVPAKTTGAASRWAVENNLADVADYGKIHVDVANDMNRSLLEHIKAFPELRASQKFIGTCQNQFSLWHEQARAKYEKTLIERGASEESAKSISKRVVKKPTVKGTTWAHSMDHPDLKGIAVNKKWGEDLTAFRKVLDKGVEAKFHPIGCNTVKSVADHEFGHQLDLLLKLTDSNVLPGQKFEQTEIQRLYIEAKQAGIKENVSQYAGTNIKEFVAEAWAEALNNPQPRRFAREVERIVRDEYKKQFKSGS